MGTNFYLYTDACDKCGRSDGPLHIGKSSSGWHFALHVIPEKDINSLDNWIDKIIEQPYKIMNEYEERLSLTELLQVIKERKSHSDKDNRDWSDSWYKENHAEKGLNGLARNVVDGSHCIGHGSGTWDLITGEFC